MSELRTAAGPLRLTPADPWLMATVEAGSGAGAHARELIAAGARIIAVSAGRECAATIAELAVTVKVPLVVVGDDPAEVAAAIEAGASIVDASARPASPELVSVCARARAALVLAPETADRVRAALPPMGWAHGFTSQIGSARLPAGDRPRLVHAEAPTLARELAGLARASELEASMIAVGDVAATVDYLAVRAALNGRRAIDPGLRLAPELRREPAAAAPEHPSN